MKAIGISSSGRKGSYSRIIVQDILEESGVEYEMINLVMLNIKGFLGCLQCASDNRCVQKDDFQRVIDKMLQADALVAEENRPVEYGCKAQKEAKAIGKMLGSILDARE
jgi:multimeric flavodoxin WrbA